MLFFGKFRGLGAKFVVA